VPNRLDNVYFSVPLRSCFAGSGRLRKVGKYYIILKNAESFVNVDNL